VEFVGQADPVRYILIAARGLFLQDMPVSVVLQQAWPMAVIAAVAMAIASVAVRRAVS
jgi:ABC-2 type transport system permease protein